MTSPSELIGLDVGKKRTGMARASSGAKLAEPLKTVTTGEVIKALHELAKDGDISAIIVGLPRNLQGEDTAQTSWVRDFVDQAKKQINLPFYWQDEALTSHIAEARQKLTGKIAQDVDSVAATFILQDFLDTPPAERVVC